MKSLVTIVVLLSSVFAFAKVKSEKVVYAAGEAKLEGFLYYDAAQLAKKKKLPGVVIVHDWMGVGDYVKMRAEQMASRWWQIFTVKVFIRKTQAKPVL